MSCCGAHSPFSGKWHQHKQFTASKQYFLLKSCPETSDDTEKGSKCSVVSISYLPKGSQDEWRSQEKLVKTSPD